MSFASVDRSSDLAGLLGVCMIMICCYICVGRAHDPHQIKYVVMRRLGRLGSTRPRMHMHGKCVCFGVGPSRMHGKCVGGSGPELKFCTLSQTASSLPPWSLVVLRSANRCVRACLELSIELVQINYISGEQVPVERHARSSIMPAGPEPETVPL